MNEIAIIWFDAGGTLLFPQPAVGEVYAAVGRRYGSRLDPTELTRRFRAAFRRQEALDAATGWQSSAARELARWRAIVAETLDDVTDFERCFAALYEHFAQPGVWTCAPQTAAVLRELFARGYRLGIASNFDDRLHAICAGKSELSSIHYIHISAAGGWSKPAPEFFKEAAQLADLPPSRNLVIGDDLRNDYHGARNAGFAALLFDPHGRWIDSPAERISSLDELLTRCPPVR
jgi:putative hydrolase of the HAD superfamily